MSSQLKEYYGRAADLIVPPAPTVPTADDAAVAAMRERLSTAAPNVGRWVLTVGQEVARKNFVRLADAVTMLDGVGLVVAGPSADPAVGEALDARRTTTPLVRLGYTDDMRADLALQGIAGKRLTYRRIGEDENA